MDKVRHMAGNPQGRRPVAREGEAKWGPILKTNLLLSFLKLFMTLVHNRHSSVDKLHCPSLAEDNGKLCYLPLRDWQYVTGLGKSLTKTSEQSDWQGLCVSAFCNCSSFLQSAGSVFLSPCTASCWHNWNTTTTATSRLSSGELYWKWSIPCNNIFKMSFGFTLDARIWLHWRPKEKKCYKFWKHAEIFLCSISPKSENIHMLAGRSAFHLRL